MNGRLIAGRTNDSGTPVTVCSSIDTPVTPPSMKWLDTRNPLMPKPADSTPAVISPALTSSRLAPVTRASLAEDSGFDERPLGLRDGRRRRHVAAADDVADEDPRARSARHLPDEPAHGAATARGSAA